MRWYQNTFSLSSRNGIHGPDSIVERALSVSTCAKLYRKPAIPESRHHVAIGGDGTLHIVLLLLWRNQEAATKDLTRVVNGEVDVLSPLSLAMQLDEALG